MKYFTDKNNFKLIVNIIISFLISILISIFNIYFGIVLGLILIYINVFQFLKVREEKVSDLVTYLKKLNENNYYYDIKAYDEGELSKLLSELNKTTINIQSLNKELSDQKDYLKQSLENISHQLKTPLSSLLLLNQLQDKNELVDKSYDQILRLQYLIESLLTLVRLDGNMEEFDIDLYDIKTLLNSSVNLISPNLNDLEVEVVGESVNCLFDFKKSEEAILNVLNNKIRYAKQKITIEIKKAALSVLVEISDDGESIDEKLKDKIFERFYSGSKRDSKSIGIGLSISKEIMQKQGGNLTLVKPNNFVFRFNRLK